MLNFEDGSVLFQEGHAFGTENLGRFYDRLKTMRTPDDADLSEFIYPALAVEIKGMLDFIRNASDREEAVEWLRIFLKFISSCMSKNQMAARIKFELVPLEGNRPGTDEESR